MIMTEDQIKEIDKYIRSDSINSDLIVSSLDDDTAIEIAEKFLSAKPSPIYDNACIRLIYYHSRHGGKQKSLWDATIRWLKVCVNVTAETNLFFERYKLDRDEEVKRILFEVDFASANIKSLEIILTYIKNDNERYRILNYLLRNWYLPQYDIESVKRIIKQFREDSLYKKVKEYGRNITKISFSSWKAIFFAYLPFIIIYLSIFFDFSFVGLCNIKIFPIAKEEFLKNGPILYNTPEVFAEIIYLSLFLIMLGLIWFNANYIYLKSPRLFIGIIIGYLPLMAEATFIELSLSIAKIIPIILIPSSIIFFSLSYLYLSFEIKKAIGNRKKEEIRKRTFKILAQGVNYSFFLGLIFLDIFSLIMPKHSGYFHCGIIGTINPLILLFYFPIALFLGIVVQFIWEEKPITFPVK